MFNFFIALIFNPLALLVELYILYMGSVFVYGLVFDSEKFIDEVTKVTFQPLPIFPLGGGDPDHDIKILQGIKKPGVIRFKMPKRSEKK